MARIRTNNVFGTTTDNPLTAGATTMNSAGLANLGVVAGSDEALITLDPNRVNGAPEIVRVTAHTGSATSATIDRGEFDTAAREHPMGTEWIHGAVAATASDLDGDFGGIWEDYTPSNTNITVGNGTQTARFTRVGKTVTVQYELLWGSTTSYGGSIAIGLPVPCVTGRRYGNGGTGLDSSTQFYSFGLLVGEGAAGIDATKAMPVHQGAGTGRIDATTPFTWVTTDRLAFTFTYEAA